MSDTPDTPHSSFVHSHGEHHDYGTEHGTFRGYVTGFVLSVILTVIPFWLVMGDVFHENAITVILVLVLGVVQIYVHLVYFLHMNTSTEGGWQLMALSFTLILVTIVLVGSIWVMSNLHHRMMLTPFAG